MTPSTSPAPVRRSGFTLLEVLLALAISGLLLVALYAAITTQLGHAKAGRERIEQGMLARSLLNRIDADVSAAIALCDPARFRLAESSSNSSSSGGGMTGASGGSGASGGAAGGASGGASTTPNSGASGAASGSGSGSASGSGSGSSGSGSSGSGSSSSGSTTSGDAITLPLGVMGDANTLNLYVSKVPGEVWGAKPGDAGMLTCDLRRISYWLASDGPGGLARAESKLITSDDVTNNVLPSGDDAAKAIIAPEARSLSFSYYDGTAWQDSWDSTEMGPDGVTPIGAPRAIAITLGLARPGPRGKEIIKTFRHVVAIATANGATPQPKNTTNPGGGK
jgi:prepilin-type N-terminal cleavage/methylation domain-containing protein